SVTDGVAYLAGLRLRERLSEAVLRGQLYAFGHDNKAKRAAMSFTLADRLAHYFDGERNFGDQDDIGAAGKSGMQRDPASIAAHHFDYHHAVMAFGGGVQAINRVGGHMERGVEPESEFRGHQIVVNGLRDTDNFYAELRKFM